MTDRPVPPRLTSAPPPADGADWQERTAPDLPKADLSGGNAEVTAGDLRAALPGNGASPFAGLLAEARAPGPEIAEDPSDARQRTEVIRPRSRELGRYVGPYRVIEEIGSGGMAVVHKAIQPSLDRLVAIKELRAEYANDPQIAARFEREAASLATLQHGNIVPIYDYLRSEGTAYIVMEYVDGIDLFDLLAATGRLPPEVAAIIGLQVAEGLEYAHFRGIVHRDVKPSNILVSKRGEVKLMDFGIARDPAKSELTQVGLAVGTPAYMAPEQIRGDRVDQRADIFSLGVVLYEMVAGLKPWSEDDGRSVASKVLDEPYAPLRIAAPGVPSDLERIVDACLAKDPELRYAASYEVRRDLEEHVRRTVRPEPRERLVLHLRNRGFVSDTEAASFVASDLLEERTLRRRDEGVPLPSAKLLLRPLFLAHAAVLAALLFVGGLAASETVGRPLPKARPRLALERSAREGYVKIIVKPWASIYVDGELYGMAPSAIALAPGRYRIGLRNPKYLPMDRYVEVEAGRTEELKLELVPREERPQSRARRRP